MGRCHMRKGRNVIERLPKRRHGGVGKTLRLAREDDDQTRAERLIANPARRLEHDVPRICGCILEGLDELSKLPRLSLPEQRRRSPACTNHHREHERHGPTDQP